MSTAIHIRCERCASYRVERRPDPPAPRAPWILRVLNWSPKPLFPPSDEGKPGIYDCKSCGHSLEIPDPEAYARAHPITPDRCIKCDEARVELVKRDINPTGNPESLERADLYRCAACGAKFQWQTREDPNSPSL